MGWTSDLSKDFIINESDRPDGMRGTATDNALPPPGMSKGYEERDLSKFPVGSLEGAVGSTEFNKEVPLIPWEEFPARIEEQEKKKTRLSDIRMTGDKGNPIPSLDQNGQGYCWTYSTAHGITLKRAAMGLPYIRLSGHSLACKLKNFRDEGGWCGLSTSKATQIGYVPASLWPEKSMNRKYDTAENWEVAKNFCITEGFLDMQQQVWDMSLTFQQIASCILSGIPCPVDFAWWSHSILGMDLVYVTDKFPVNDIRCYGLRIWNSWRDAWGFMGTGVILGKKAVPMGATAIRNVTYYEELAT
jgi:hypothetical protein